MPIAEDTFADRLQRGRQLQSAIALFVPEFAPIDESLEAAAFHTFLDGLDTLHTATGALETAYSADVPLRTAMVKDIKDRASRVLSLIKSNPAWKNHLPGIKSLADKIRGIVPKPPKVTPPPSGPAPATPKRRSSAEQSYGDIEENFERLIAALGGVSGYTPPAAEITIANLTTLANTYAAKNLSMATTFSQLGTKQRDRLTAFAALKEKMKAIKQAARGQYGTSSPQFDQIGGISL